MSEGAGYWQRVAKARFSRRAALAFGGLGGAVAVGAALRLSGFVKRPPASEAASISVRAQTNHLFRRAAFGASRLDLDQHGDKPPAAIAAILVNYQDVPNDALEARLEAANLDMTKRDALQRWWLLRMMYSTRPFEERMTLFWHGLLTTAFTKVNKPDLLLQQNDFLRRNALGSFRDILVGISKDPAMLIWLDGATNRKGKPNENYARELMELFSMGIGNYTEDDVREGARALTGWTLAGAKEGPTEAVFRAAQHDDGQKTFLGQTGNFGLEEIVDIIVKQPATAQYLSRRLFSFFAYPDPEPQVIQPLVDAYFASGYSVKAMVEQLFALPAFYSPRAYRAIVSSPVDFIVGMARTLDIETDATGLPGAMASMNQQLFNPPDVSGWDGGMTWLNGSTWFARMNLVNRLTTARKSGATSAVALDALVQARALDSGQAFVDYWADLLLDGNLPEESRAMLVQYLDEGGGLTKRNLDLRGRATVYLMLASPECQLV